jgi:hypothetical protein
MWAIPGVFEPAGVSPADYERHGNNYLNNGQHVFTQGRFMKILRKNSATQGENGWKLGVIILFVLLNKRTGPLSAVAIKTFIALGSSSLQRQTPFAKFDYCEGLPRESDESPNNDYSFS